MTRASKFSAWLMVACSGLAAPAVALAQGPGGRPRPPEFNSTEVSPERKATFRIFAPKAQAVRLGSPDLPGVGMSAEMKKAENGVWETTVGPVPAGAYRYSFQVDGVTVVDPRNPRTSESNTHTWSLMLVPGSDAFDLKEVPHGAVAKVHYYSSTLKRFRRMHVYTPPGYEKGQGEYPVFYLLHGASDSDDSWSSVGRAGVILDNLIASGKAKPMIVVMPAGHTGPFSFGGRGADSFQKQMDEFAQDFRDDVRPYVEKNYRVKAGRSNRAIAGLSMGGAQTLNVAFDKLSDYGYIGVYSSGVFGIAGGFGGSAPSTEWEDSHKAALDDASLKEGLKLVWFACGKDDFLVKTSQATVEMLRKHKFDVIARESDGGHTWLNWRDYLAEFTPMLFREG
ncbi:MAG: alpha/beta hydrolase-fold protein [Isosphaeraceae bacterium]